MKAILEGIRVVDWTLWHAGPAAGAMLADMGADVIHIEEPGKGEAMRGFTTMFGTKLALPNGRNALFEDLNRNKKSLAVNLKLPEGKQIIYRLIEKSDVFLTNYRSEAARPLGLDYDTLSKHYPRLVYGSVSTFGDRGPLANAPGLELTGYARSGGMLTAGEEWMPPIYAPGVADRMGGIFLAYGIIAALLARERHGVGQEVKTSILGDVIALISTAVITRLFTGKEQGRQTRAKAHNPLWNWYQCSDKRWLALGLVQSDRDWPIFCRVVGIIELEKDPRFVNAEKRDKNCEELVKLLDQIFAAKPLEEWEKLLGDADLVISRVNRISDLLTDEQILANNNIVDWSHPAVGPWKAVGFPVDWSKTPATLRNPAPECGQHTEELLTDLLGYTWEEIADLKQKNVI